MVDSQDLRIGRRCDNGLRDRLRVAAVPARAAADLRRNVGYWVVVDVVSGPFNNFFMPVVGYSSNFISVGNWCGSVPLVINPSCGKVPEPLAVALLWAFGMLFFAILGCGLLGACERRFGPLSVAKQLLIAGLFGVVCDLPLDFVAVQIRLWNFWAPDMFSIGGAPHRFPLLIFVAAFVLFAPIVVLRHSKDDRGRTVFERGLDDLPRSRRRWLVMGSTAGAMSVIMTTATFGFVVPLGFYARDVAPYPAYVVNGVCDNPGHTDTSYGPCPGTPGFRMPIRGLSDTGE
jgi:Spirocyclase AveC-like